MIAFGTKWIQGFFEYAPESQVYVVGHTSHIFIFVAAGPCTYIFVGVAGSGQLGSVGFLKCFPQSAEDTKKHTFSTCWLQ